MNLIFKIVLIAVGLRAAACAEVTLLSATASPSGRYVLGVVTPSVAHNYGYQELGFFDTSTKAKIGKSLVRRGYDVDDSQPSRTTALWNADESRVAISTGMRIGTWVRVFQRSKTGFVELATPDYEVFLARSVPGFLYATRSFIDARAWHKVDTLRVHAGGTAYIPGGADNYPDFDCDFLLRFASDGNVTIQKASNNAPRQPK